jgi:TetR/AcrR family transcriptional regulator, transcriptional repressor for nem operon
LNQVGRPREFDVDEALQKALEAFWERGYEGTSLADLMASMDLQKGSIYNAFGDKHSLFLQTLTHYLEGRFEKSRLVLEAPGPVKTALFRWLDLAFGLSESCETNRGCFAVNALVELAPHDPEVARSVGRYFENLQALMALVIERGQRSGELRLDETAEDLAELLLAMVIGTQAQTRGSLPRTQRQRLARLATRLLSG